MHYRAIFLAPVVELKPFQSFGDLVQVPYYGDGLGSWRKRILGRWVENKSNEVPDQKYTYERDDCEGNHHFNLRKSRLQN